MTNLEYRRQRGTDHAFQTTREEALRIYRKLYRVEIAELRKFKAQRRALAARFRRADVQQPEMED